MTLRTLNYGNYGIFLIMGNAGFCPSTVVLKYEGPLYSCFTLLQSVMARLEIGKPRTPELTANARKAGLGFGV